jgi:GNAT superfamily N-acetyltransferase
MSAAGPEIAIREAEVGDAAAVASLWGELGYPCSANVAAERLGRLGDSDRVLMAVEEERVAGLVSTHLMPLPYAGELCCRVTSLVVTEGGRGRGVGGALLDHVERLAREAGAGRVEVTCAERREDAHRFYARRGYVERRKRFVRRIEYG